jgi:N-acyl-D-aspartate/D-glutamate deacylase
MDDLLIKNGNIFDGTGAEPFRGDIAIKDGIIREVKDSINDDAKAIFDARGLGVGPGFIDLHSHSDLQIFRDPFAKPKIYQGVTTEVIGNDGLTVAPNKQEDFGLKTYLRPLLGKVDLDWSWHSFAEYLLALENSKPAVNLCCFAPHNTIRAYVGGFSSNPLSHDQMKEMKELVVSCMKEGAVGLSTGLLYSPGCFSDTNELTELCKIVAEFNGVHVSHIRNESDFIRESLTEILSVGLENGCRTNISHLKVSGKNNWGLAPVLLKMMDQARNKGIGVTCDQYPYPAGSTILSAILPPWSLEGGLPELLKNLSSNQFRQSLAESVKNGISGWDNVIAAVGYENIIVNGVSSVANQFLEGKSLAEIARIKGNEVFEALCNLLIEEKGEVTIIVFQQLQEDLKEIASYKYTAVGTDGVYSDRRPHPRLYGTFPRVLGRFAREEHWFSMAEAVRKMTSLPASIIDIADLGKLWPGYKADIVIFDIENCLDTATFAKPVQNAQGIKTVIVSGEIVLNRGQLTGARPGKILRRNYHG